MKTLLLQAWILAATMALAVSPAVAAQAPSSPSAAPPDSGRRLQFLPHGLLYRSYIAGEKEPRIGAQWLNDNELGWVWETAFGARVPIWRYGTEDPLEPVGWQLDVEGAAFTRIDIGTGTDVDAVDFRTGFLLTWRQGRTAIKGGIYHISAHIGDEFVERNPDFVRRDYVRDSFIAGVTYDLTRQVSVYGELGYAGRRQDGAEPIEAQFGIQYNPQPHRGSPGRPFFAINAHLRQEFGLRPSVNAQGGLQWRSSESMRTLRTGLQYFNGQSLQYSFYDMHEEWLGIGVWLDM